MKNTTIETLLQIFLVFISLLSLNAQAGVEITYIHNDALGTPVAGTDEQGNVKWRAHYQPYGEELLGERQLFGVRAGYTGHRDDPDTGLTYMGARYYSPTIGRFMGVDPSGVDLSDIHSFNRYAYANNNPYKYVDPNGETVALVAGIGIGLAVTIVVLNNAIEGTLDALRNENADVDSEIDRLTDGLDNEKDSRGRDRRGNFIDPEGNAQEALDSLPGEPDNNEGKILPDGSRAGLHDSSGSSGGRSGGNSGSTTLHVNRPKGKQDIKIRFNE